MAESATRLVDNNEADVDERSPAQGKGKEDNVPTSSPLNLQDASTTTTTTATEATPSPAPNLETAPLQQVLEFPPSLRGKHILLATESLGPINGVSRTTLSLIQYLRRNDVHVAIVAPSAPGRASQADDIDNLEIRLKGFPLPYNPELAIAYPFCLSRLYQRTFVQPDLIYLASPASLGFQILLQMRAYKPSPVVLCNFQTDLSAYCEILFPAPLDDWAVWVLRSTQGYLFSHPAVRTVFYPSLPVRNYIEQSGVPPSKLLNLRRGVDTDHFNPSARSLSYRAQFISNPTSTITTTTATTTNPLILLSVCRLAPEKGFDFLAAVAVALHARSLPFHLQIVGGNRNPAVSASVRNLFTSLPPSSISFTGTLEGAALARAYASADLFLHSSITETFGLVVLEAMASGLPVVARDEGGPSEIVVHERSGFLVPPAGVEAFVKKVVLLAGDEELRKGMGRQARDIACGATWEKINHRVATRFADVLADQAASFPSSSPSKPSPNSFLTSLKLVLSLLIIHGIWAGLLITWALVLLVNTLKSLFRTKKSWGLLPWVLSGLRRWRKGRLRDRVREREALLKRDGVGSGGRRV